MRRRAEIRVASHLAATPEAMLSQRLWEHERTIDPAPGDGRLHGDRPGRLGAAPPVPGRLLPPPFAAVFRHRHRRLRRHFGAAAAQ
jgi:hypothetical protein